jgi:hypothetical protein
MDVFLEAFQLTHRRGGRRGRGRATGSGASTKGRRRVSAARCSPTASCCSTPPGSTTTRRRTARTLTSLPDADAVIFVLSANRFLTDLERRTLTPRPVAARPDEPVLPRPPWSTCSNAISDDPVHRAAHGASSAPSELLGELARRAPVLPARRARCPAGPLGSRSLQAPRTTPDDDPLGRTGHEPLRRGARDTSSSTNAAPCSSLVGLHGTAPASATTCERQRRGRPGHRQHGTVDELRRARCELEPSLPGSSSASQRRVSARWTQFVERTRT